MCQKQKHCPLILAAFSIITFVISFDAIAQTSAENLYSENCLICHGDDGSGAMPGVVDLTVNRRWATMNELALVERLKQGIQPPGAQMSMPPKGGNPDLTDNDLKALIRYMRTVFLK